jgi:type IV secretion system protein VirB2
MSKSEWERVKRWGSVCKCGAAYYLGVVARVTVIPVILFMSLMQPSDAAIPTAVEWAVGVLLGSVATGLAVLAVAFLGFGMLLGHLDWRTGTRVVLGIFILFGAPMIARELAGFARSGEAAESGQVAAGAIPQQPALPKNAPVADPYAGAGMPQR